MTECDEIAFTLEAGYHEWVEKEARANTRVAAFVYADLQLPDEGMVFRNNVAEGLWRRVEPRKSRPDFTGDSPLAGSW